MNDTTEISANKVGGAVAVPDILSLLEAPSIFNRAKFLRAGSVLQHLPLIFWMVESLRPARIVTLGGSDGVVHFAVCQAVERLGLASTCVCYADWPDGTVPEDIAAYDDQQYQEFSELVAMSPMAAAEQVDPGSVDLIVVDEPEGDALDWLVEAGWLDRLSDRSVLMVHRARKGDLPKIICDSPVFDFPHGSGMVVSGGGSALPARLDKLFNVSQHGLQSQALRHVFRRLGLGQAAEGEVRSEAARRADAEGRAAEAENQLVILGLELTKMRDLLDTRETELQELEKANTKLKEIRLEIEQGEVEITRLHQSVKDRDARNDALAEQVQKLESQLSSAKVAHRNEEAVHKDLKAAKTEANDLRIQIDTIRTEAEAAQKDAKQSHSQELEAAQKGLQLAVAEANDLRVQIDTVRTEAEAARKDAKRIYGHELESLNKRLQAAGAEVETALTDADAARADAEGLRSAIDALHTEVEVARKDAESSRIEQDALKHEGAAASEIARELQAERDKLAEDLAALSDRLRRADSEMAAMAKKIAESGIREVSTNEELAKLKIHLKAADSEMAAMAKKIAESGVREVGTNEELAKLKIHLKAIERARDDILTSTSWKVTSPMRFLSGKFRS